MAGMTGRNDAFARMTLLRYFLPSTSYCLRPYLVRTFEFAGVDDEHLQAVLDVRETCIRVVVEAQDLHVRTTFLHGLRESAATDVVREAGERLDDDETVDAVFGVVQDFCRDEPAFARVVRRVDNAVDVVHEFIAVGVVFVKLERLHHLLCGFCCMRKERCGDAAFDTVADRVRRESTPDLFGAYHFVDAEEVHHAGEVDFHAVVHQVVFDVTVGARVVVHEDFAKHGDARLADALLAGFRDFDLVEFFDAGAQHFDKAFR